MCFAILIPVLCTIFFQVGDFTSPSSTDIDLYKNDRIISKLLTAQKIMKDMQNGISAMQSDINASMSALQADMKAILQHVSTEE